MLVGEFRGVNKSLAHLPPLKHAELRLVVNVVRGAFGEAISTRRAARLKVGRILKMIPDGSYALNDWVHDPVGHHAMRGTAVLTARAGALGG